MILFWSVIALIHLFMNDLNGYATTFLHQWALCFGYLVAGWMLDIVGHWLAEYIAPKTITVTEGNTTYVFHVVRGKS